MITAGTCRVAPVSLRDRIASRARSRVENGCSPEPVPVSRPLGETWKVVSAGEAGGSCIRDLGGLAAADEGLAAAAAGWRDPKARAQIQRNIGNIGCVQQLIRIQR